MKQIEINFCMLMCQLVYHVRCTWLDHVGKGRKWT